MQINNMFSKYWAAVRLHQLTYTPERHVLRGLGFTSRCSPTLRKYYGVPKTFVLWVLHLLKGFGPHKTSESHSNLSWGHLRLSGVTHSLGDFMWLKN